MDGAGVEQPRGVEAGEDALAAAGVVADPRQLELVALAVDELDARRAAEAGQPPPAAAPGGTKGRAEG